MSRSIHAKDLGNNIIQLTINRPDIRNALSKDVREDLLEALDQASNDDKVHAVVLCGAGGNFCAGGDIRTMRDMSERQAVERMDAVSAAVLAIASFPKGLVVAISGHASGAGIGLALLGDAVVADQSARLSFSFRKLGLGPDWGLSHTLPERVSQSQSRRLIMTASTLTGIEAFRGGVIDQCFETETDMMAAAAEIARDLAIDPRRFAVPVKSQLSNIECLTKTLEREAKLQVQRFMSIEHKTAVADFFGQSPSASTSLNH